MFAKSHKRLGPLFERGRTIPPARTCLAALALVAALLPGCRPADADTVETGFSLELLGKTTYRGPAGSKLHPQIRLLDSLRVPLVKGVTSSRRILSESLATDSPLDAQRQSNNKLLITDHLLILKPPPNPGHFVRFTKIILHDDEGSRDTLQIAPRRGRIAILPPERDTITSHDHTNSGFAAILLPPRRLEVKPGQRVNLGIRVEDVTAADLFEVSLEYDSTLVSPENFQTGDFLDDLTTSVSFEDGLSEGRRRVHVEGLSEFGQAGVGAGLLGSLQFEVIRPIPPAGTAIHVEKIVVSISANDADTTVFAPGQMALELVPHLPRNPDATAAFTDTLVTLGTDSAFSVGLSARGMNAVSVYELLLRLSPPGAFGPRPPGLTSAPAGFAAEVTEADGDGLVRVLARAQDATALDGDRHLGNLLLSAGPDFDPKTASVELLEAGFSAGAGVWDLFTPLAGGRISFAAPAARADFNSDGAVNFKDFFLFVDAVGSNDPLFDLDGDGRVGTADFFVLLKAFDPPVRGKLASLFADRAVASGPLGSNYPNPFNSATTLNYRLAAPGRVRFEIFNLGGQRIRTLVDGPSTAGLHRIVWDGTDERGYPVSSGMYLGYLWINSAKWIRKMTYIQ